MGISKRKFVPVRVCPVCFDLFDIGLSCRFYNYFVTLSRPSHRNRNGRTVSVYIPINMKDNEKVMVYYGNTISKGMSASHAALTTWGYPVRKPSLSPIQNVTSCAALTSDIRKDTDVWSISTFEISQYNCFVPSAEFNGYFKAEIRTCTRMSGREK